MSSAMLLHWCTAGAPATWEALQAPTNPLAVPTTTKVSCRTRAGCAICSTALCETLKDVPEMLVTDIYPAQISLWMVEAFHWRPTATFFMVHATEG